MTRSVVVAAMWRSFGADVRSYAKISERRPARAEYAAIDEPALPLDTTEVAVKPNCSAAATPVADERSFTVPVGLAPSNLMLRLRTPSAFASRGQSSSGVLPSPSVTRWAGTAIGSTGAYRHRPRPDSNAGPCWRRG